MTQFEIKYHLVVEAETKDDAIDEARLLLSDPRFEPVSVTKVEGDLTDTGLVA